MTLRDLRGHLGLRRDRLLYGARDRRLRVAAETARAEWIDAAAAALPPLPEPAAAGAEVHTLCGEAQAGMGLWAVWSLMRFLPEARLVVHSDGTLAPATVVRWRQLMPGARFVAHEEGMAAAGQRLTDVPRVLDWTRRYHFGLKLGFHAVAEADRIVDMDSDVLVLSEPRAVRDCLASGTWRMAWNRDEKACYAYPEDLIREIYRARTGSDALGRFPDRLNGGFMIAGRLEDADWRFLEELLAALAADPRTDPMRYWMHQTLFAAIAATKGEGARPLPEGYDIHSGPTRPEAVVRHYVGNAGIRPRFFTEGVAAVVRDARRCGQLPDGFFREAVPD